jgi:hypothetical protein
LDRGEGNKNAMIAPQVPARGLIGQAVFDDEAHGQGNDTMRVAAFGQRVCGHVRREVSAALGAVMLRVDKMEVTRSGGDQVPHVVKNTREDTVAWATFPASRTLLVFEVAAAPNDLGFRQILWAGDTLSGVGPVCTGTGHGKALLGQAFPARNLRLLRVSSIITGSFEPP